MLEIEIVFTGIFDDFGSISVAPEKSLSSGRPKPNLQGG
jgi:hypothetical protein